MRGTALLAGGAAVAAVVTLLVLTSPVTLLIVIAAAVVIALMTDPVGRLALFIVGGIVAMGGSSGLDVPKLAYAAIAVTCFLVSWVRMSSRSSEPSSAKQIRCATWATVIMLSVIFVATIIGVMAAREPALISQDAFTYVLIAISIMIGLDAGLSLRLRPILVLAVGAGALASVSWAVWWLARRGSSVGGLERLALVTSFFGIAVFAIALVMMVNSSARIARISWAVFAVAIPTIYIVSGSRSMLVFVIGIVGLLGAKRFGRLQAPGFLIVAAALILLTVGAITFVVPLLPDGSAILARFSRTFAMIENDGLEGDGSFDDRSRAYAYTAQYFWESPLFGQGFGLVYPSVRASAAGDLKVDSPLLVLSKLGVVGTLAMIAVVLLVWTIIRSSRGPGRLRLGETAFRIFVLVSVFRSAFVAPTEEKGFAYSIAILIAFSIAAAGSRQTIFRYSSLERSEPRPRLGRGSPRPPSTMSAENPPRARGPRLNGGTHRFDNSDPLE